MPSWPSIRGEDVGRSLAEMAQRDLDAALQLLADRAQFITGASGAAIALRRQGMNDMLCRASTGSNAPELGALLSTEFGLSGESVRTRQLLRCDDAERDARVNREVCRQLGIASVVVMPVVHDDEVLGVFELFSGKRNAFGERDLSAVQRLGQMVETAVQLAHVTQKLPEKLKASEAAVAAAANSAVEEEILDEHILEVEAEANPAKVKEEADVLPTAPESSAQEGNAPAAAKQTVAPVVPPTAGTAPAPLGAAKTLADASPVAQPNAVKAGPDADEKTAKPAKALFWSAGASPAVSEQAGESEESHIPPVLRGLRKCEACGFPISGGRVLCVECEEKRWKGQLRRPQAMPTGAIPQNSGSNAVPRSLGAFAAAAAGPVSSAAVAGKTAVVPATLPEPSNGPASAQGVAGVREKSPYGLGKPSDVVPGTPTESSTETFVLSSGLQESQSWISSNKYVIGAMALVAVLITVFFLLR